MIEGEPRDKPQPATSPTRLALVATVCFVAGVLLLAALWYAASFFLLAFAAVLVAIVLRAEAEWVAERTPLSPGWALAAVVVAHVATLVVGVWLLAGQIADQSRELSDSLAQSVSQVRTWLEAHEWGRAALASVPTTEEPGIGGASVFSRATGLASTVFGVLGDVVIVAVLAVYLAADPRAYERGLLRVVPLRKRKRVGEVLAKLAYTLRWWMIGRLASMIAVGLLTGLGLMLLGIPLSVTVGLLAGLLDFVPNIGPLVAAVPALLLALGHGPERVLAVAALFLVIQTLEGYLLTPLVEKRTVSLRPAVTIAAQVFAALTLGGLGLVLASPLVATAMVLVSELYVRDVLGDDSAQVVADEETA